MNACQEWIEPLSALVDGELSGPERERVLAHLEQCPGCRRYYEELLLLDRTLEDDRLPAPEGFQENVMARVRETPQERKRITVLPRRWQRWAALAACLAVIVGVAAVIGLPGGKGGGASGGSISMTMQYSGRSVSSDAAAPAEAPVAGETEASVAADTEAPEAADVPVLTAGSGASGADGYVGSAQSDALTPSAKQTSLDGTGGPEAYGNEMKLVEEAGWMTVTVLAVEADGESFLTAVAGEEGPLAPGAEVTVVPEDPEETEMFTGLVPGDTVRVFYTAYNEETLCAETVEPVRQP